MVRFSGSCCPAADAQSSVPSDPSPNARLLSFEELPRTQGDPIVHGLLRGMPEDFVVDETLSFTPEDRGPHTLLRVRKRSANTEWVARRLASVAEVPARDVGYAGLKDRHAVTTQWFSIPLGDRPPPDWSALVHEGIEVLETRRHGRKLRRGAIESNRFELRLRQVSGNASELAKRVDRLRQHGAPNYFGAQRFGHQGANLVAARALFQGDRGGGRMSRHRRGLLLSAARSALFNQVLAERVRLGSWNQAIPGDRLELAGSHSHFLVEEVDPVILDRVDNWDLSPTGPLCGSGGILVQSEAAQLEARVLEPWADWIAGLARSGLRQERRALRVLPSGLECDIVGEDQLLLRFALPAGAYATAVLRELALCTEPAIGDAREAG